MFCENCGAKMEENSVFCANCGTKNEANSIATVPVTTEQNILPQEAATVQKVVQVVPKEKQPPRKGAKMLALEIVVLLAAVAAFFFVATKLSQPETVAKQYFEAKNKGNWEKAFQMLDLPESKLLKKEIYMSTVKQNKIKDITNYKVESSDWPYNTNTDIVQNFTCSYMAAGETSMHTENIQIVKQKGKKWLIFDSWKVSPEESLSKEYTITIPKDATGELNGIALEELAAAEDDYYGKSYKLPACFPGTYALKVMAPYRQNLETNIGITAYGSYYADDMTAQPDILRQVEPQCSAMIKEYFASAIDGASYEEFCDKVKDLVTKDFDGTYLYESTYNRLFDSEYEEYHSVTVPEITYDMNSLRTDYETGELSLSISIEYTCSYTGNKIWKNWWSGEKTVEPMENMTSNEYRSMTLKLEDGQWKVHSIN